MNLPAGLVIHCSSCNVVVPEDAPRPASGGNCAWVARNKMAPWHANETLKGQHTAATAAWQMIYHAAVHGATPDAAAVAYWQQYRKNPKQHFCSSGAHQALTPEQKTAQAALRGGRDHHFYS